jgi:exocyst complex protein 7
MESCKPTDSESQDEENLVLVAAAKQILKALGSGKQLTGDVRKVLLDLSSQLSNISVTTMDDKEGERVSEIEERLNFIQEKIMSWEVDQSMIWSSGQDEAFEYLNATDEACRLIERLERDGLDKEGEDKGILRRAHDVLQTAMARLEEEFRLVLVQNKQPFEPEHMSFRSSDEDGYSFGDESMEVDSFRRDSVSRASEESMIDLIHTEVIPYLRFIVEVMFNSNYEQECTQTYIGVRKESLDESLLTLEMEKSSIEDVLKMEWGTLDSKIRRWVRVIKYFVRVCLPSEKSLSERIFGEASLSCFIEISKASMLQLLNFGEAISIGPHRPEKLIRILDMYEMLAELLPDIDALYPDEAGCSVRNEFRHVLFQLGDCVRLTFLEFEDAIATNTSVTPFPGGGIHHLTGYVMNFLKILTDYTKTLDSLLEDVLLSPDSSPATEDENTAMAIHFQSVASILESNLYEKSKLYKDAALQHFFLMNNVHYMTQKVKNSELRHIFGDKWIRKHNWKFQQYAMDYERATWSSILAILKEEGNSGSNSGSKTAPKERFSSFYLAFEEVYKTQTTWVIRDVQLRDDLRISTSLKVIQAYRNFVGRHSNHVSEKHIKYSPDDLEDYILDLFEGSPKSLHSVHRRG